MNVIFVEKKQRNPASILGVEHLNLVNDQVQKCLSITNINCRFGTLKAHISSLGTIKLQNNKFVQKLLSFLCIFG